MAKLKSPFPYYGGKSKVAALVWERFGDVAHYIEPFAGSLAVLLGRPTPPRVETVNDTDCYLTNFWRCVRDLDGTMAELCNYPVSELDLHASHRWLVGVIKDVPKPPDWEHGEAAWKAAVHAFRGTPNREAAMFRERMRNDPEYRDPLYAARWVWGICQWIGGGWCQARDEAGQVENPEADEDRALCNGRPMIGGAELQRGQGIHGTKKDGTGQDGNVPTHEKRPYLGSVPMAERRPALSTGDGGQSHGKGIHALGPKTTHEIMPGHPEKGINVGERETFFEQIPGISGGAARGIHQDGDTETALWERGPDVSQRGPTGAKGIHAGGRDNSTDEAMPVMDYCRTTGRGVHGVGDTATEEKLPVMDKCLTTGRGVHGVGEQPADDERALSEGRPQLADAYDVGRGVHSGGKHGTMEARLQFLRRWFLALADRLRLVRICCGDWKRVCASESVTTRLGLCGVFLDPPYGKAAKRDNRLYGTDSLTVADDVRAWCIEHGPEELFRICLAGYEEEHRELSDKYGWTMVAWESKGYGSRTEKGRENQKKERLWFSPHCLVPAPPKREPSLFD